MIDFETLTCPSDRTWSGWHHGTTEYVATNDSSCLYCFRGICRSHVNTIPILVTKLKHWGGSLLGEFVMQLFNFDNPIVRLVKPIGVYRTKHRASSMPADTAPRWVLPIMRKWSVVRTVLYQSRCVRYALLCWLYCNSEQVLLRLRYCPQRVYHNKQVSYSGQS